jgi:hypothetical protein
MRPPIILFYIRDEVETIPWHDMKGFQVSGDAHYRCNNP